jgi:hypothetical protein
MTGINEQISAQGSTIADSLKGWMMVLLTLVFVLLYASALIGWLKPLADLTILTRLEPIIFVIIGYYFGRLPSQQNERSLRDEIGRQTQKADATQFAKERALQERESLEEKIKNARVALHVGFTDFLPDKNAVKRFRENGDVNDVNKEAARKSIETAVGILSS